jgi:pimeloyl-ACP methyl ester carboxylesterase
MEPYDDLSKFEADGAAPVPPSSEQGYVECDGARICYATYGSGLPVILLHGGLGLSGKWGYLVPALLRSGYRAVLIDSRGHGRSTRKTTNGYRPRRTNSTSFPTRSASCRKRNPIIRRMIWQ